METVFLPGNNYNACILEIPRISFGSESAEALVVNSCA